MKNKKLFLEDNGYYWVKSKYTTGKPEIVKYSKKPEGFNLIGSSHFMHIDNYEVISKIILRETNYEEIN